MNGIGASHQLLTRLARIARAATTAVSIACSAMTAISLPASAQGPLEQATLRLDWLASGYHVPFFLALERGYYRGDCIVLQIFSGKGSTITVLGVDWWVGNFGAPNIPSLTLVVY